MSGLEPARSWLFVQVSVTLLSVTLMTRGVPGMDGNVLGSGVRCKFTLPLFSTYLKKFNQRNYHQFVNKIIEETIDADSILWPHEFIRIFHCRTKNCFPMQVLISFNASIPISFVNEPSMHFIIVILWHLYRSGAFFLSFVCVQRICIEIMKLVN